VSKCKSKPFLWIVALLAIPLIAGGIAGQALCIARFDLRGLFAGWACAMVGKALLILFVPDRPDAPERLRVRLARLVRAAVDTFLHGVGLGLLMLLLAYAFVSLGSQEVTECWWEWGLGAALMGLLLWSIFHGWKKRKQQRRARILGDFVAFGLLAVISAIVLGSRDIDPAPGDERALGGRPRPAAADNAYRACVAATNALNNLPRKPLNDITGEEAVRIVGSNTVALALLHRAANSPAWYDEDMDPPSGFSVFPVVDFFRLHILERIKIRADLKRGRIHDALQTARDLALHARLMLEQAQTVRAWDCAAAIRQTADKALMDILASGKATDDDLADMRGIQSLTESPDGWDLTRLSEEEFRNFLSRIISGTAESQYIHGSIKTDSVVGRYFYHPERTRATAIRLTAHYLDILRRPGYEQATWDEANKTAHRILETSIRHPWLPGQNAFGAILLTSLGTNWENVARMKALSEFSHDAARLALAIEAHRRRTGRTPTTLDELVPAFLNAVPPDPFNLPGRLNYDPRQGIVWTVGKNKSCTGVRTRSKAAPYGPGNSKYVWNVDGTPLP